MSLKVARKLAHAICMALTIQLFATSFSNAQTPLDSEPPGMVASVSAPEHELTDSYQASIEARQAYGVHPFNGEFVFEQTDLVIEGVGFPFVWKRTYRSRGGFDGPHGPNWDHSYNIYVEEVAGTNDLLLHDGNGRADRFIPYVEDADQWWSPGHFRIIRKNSDDSFTVVLRNNGKWELAPIAAEHSGKLTAILDRNGNEMTFEYEDGLLKYIYDTLHVAGQNERRITLFYDREDHITKIRDFASEYGANGLGREVKYTYLGSGSSFGLQGDLRAVVMPAIVGTSTGNDFPLGKKWLFKYPTGFGSRPELQHNLLSVTDPKGQEYLKNVYSNTATSSYLYDRVLSQEIEINGGAFFHYTYVDALVPGIANNFADKKTIVNDPMGNVSELFYSSDNFLLMLHEYTGRADATLATTDTANRPVNPLRSGGGLDYVSDPVLFETLIEYDGNGLMTKVVEPNGNFTEWLYDFDNDSQRSRANLRRLRRTAGVLGGDQEELVKTWAHEDRYNRVVAKLNSNGHAQQFNIQNAGEVSELMTITSPPASVTGQQPYLQPGTSSKIVREGGETQALASILTSLSAAAAATSDIVYNMGDGGNETEEDCGEDDDPPASSFAGGTIICTDCYGRFFDTKGRLISESDPEGSLRTFSYYEDPTDFQYGYLKSVVEAKTDPSMPQEQYFDLTTQFTYDRLGNVLTMTDPRGNVVTYERNAAGQVVVETGPNGSYVETLYYDANDNLIQQDTKNFESSYDSVSMTSSHVVDSTNPEWTRSYEFDALDNVVAIEREVDPTKDVRVEFEYDNNQNTILVSKGEAVSGGQPSNTIELAYDERDLLFTRTRAAGTAIESSSRFDYDGNGNLTVLHLGEGSGLVRHLHRFYDGFDRLVALRDAMGNEVLYEYDPNSNLITQRVYGEELDTSDDGSANILLSEWIKDFDGRDRLEDLEVSHFINVGGMPQYTAYHPVQRVWEYDEVSNPKNVTDSNGYISTANYDTAHRVKKRKDALFNEVSVEAYDENSNPVLIAELDRAPGSAPDQILATALTYDELNRVVFKQVAPVLNEEKRGYDSRDNLVYLRDGNQNETRYYYDGLSRLVATAIDMDGDGASELDSDDIVTRNEWDDSSRLVAQIDDSGNATRYFYDGLDRRIATLMADGTFSQSGVGAVAGSGGTIDFTNFQNGYDVHGNLLLSRDANGSEVANTYDKNFRLITRVITRATGILGAELEEYFYDGLGRLIEGRDEDSIVTRKYDSMGNIVEETQAIHGGAAQVIVSSFDGEGNMISCAYPHGRLIETTFDGLNRMDLIKSNGSLLADYSYLGKYLVRNRHNFETDGAGSFDTEYEYNYSAPMSGNPSERARATKRVTHVEDFPFEIYDEFEFSWDAVGNKLSRENTVNQRLQTFGYDKAYRLKANVEEVGSPPITTRNLTYHLDQVNNRESVVDGGNSTSYQLEGLPPNQVHQYSHTEIDERQYDDNGNLTNKNELVTGLPIATILYDYRNQMVRYEDATGPVHEYSYDVFGRRIAKVVDAEGTPEETRFVYGGQANWQVLEEQDELGVLQAEYVHGRYIDETLRMWRDYDADGTVEEITLLDDDQHSTSAILVTGEAGVQERVAIEDFGSPEFLDGAGAATLSIRSVVGNPYLFHGRRFDSETGLYQYRHRYLDPSVGNFTTRDPIGIWTDPLQLGNAHSFAGCNPWTWLDPLGLAAQDSWTPSPQGRCMQCHGDWNAINGGAGLGAEVFGTEDTVRSGQIAVALFGSVAVGTVAVAAAPAISAGAATTKSAAIATGAALAKGCKVIPKVLGKAPKGLGNTAKGTGKASKSAKEAAKEQFRKDALGLEPKVIRQGRDGTGKIIGVGTKGRGGPTYRPKLDGSYSVGVKGDVKHFRPSPGGGHTVNQQ